MTIIVCKIFFCFLIKSSNCWKHLYFGWNLLYLSEKRSLTKLGYQNCQTIQVWRDLRQVSSKDNPGQSWTKYLRQTLDFMWNRALQGKFNFFFSGVFCCYLKTFPFEMKTEQQVLILSSFKIFLAFSKIPSLKLFWNSCSLLIIILCFICGERKI